MKSRPSIVKLLSVVLIIFVIMGIGFFGFQLFSKRAENSKALSELKQAHEILLTNLVSTDGSADKVLNCDGIVFKYELTKGKVVFSGSLNSNDGGATLTRELRESVPELGEIGGSFNCEGNTITYTTENGKGKALWVSGKLPSSYK